jgi:hypothetical protein
MKPRRKRCFLNVTGVDMAYTAGFGRQQNDEPTLGKVGESIYESIHEVAVILTPPKDNRICDVAIVLLDQFGATKILNGQPDVVIDVLVIPEFLDHLSSGKAQLRH